VEIERKGQCLLISSAEKRRDLDSLEEHPEYIVGNPDDLVHNKNAVWQNLTDRFG
jgi:hypothetical protein